MWQKLVNAYLGTDIFYSRALSLQKQMENCECPTPLNMDKNFADTLDEFLYRIQTVDINENKISVSDSLIKQIFTQDSEDEIAYSMVLLILQFSSADVKNMIRQPVGITEQDTCSVLWHKLLKYYLNNTVFEFEALDCLDSCWDESDNSLYQYAKTRLEQDKHKFIIRQNISNEMIQKCFRYGHEKLPYIIFGLWLGLDETHLNQVMQVHMKGYSKSKQAMHDIYHDWYVHVFKPFYEDGR